MRVVISIIISVLFFLPTLAFSGDAQVSKNQITDNIETSAAPVGEAAVSQPEQEVDLIVEPPVPDEVTYEGTVTKVISANLIEVDGNQMWLLGVRAPERWWWGTRRDCFSMDVSNYLSDEILGKKVRYQFETSFMQKERLVTPRIYLYFDDRFLNAELIAKGFALASHKTNYRFTEGFKKLEGDARFYSLGLWHSCVIECSSMGSKICRIRN